MHVAPSGYIVFTDVLPIIPILLDHLHIDVLNFIFITYVCIDAGETSTLAYLYP
jgi:hypothetical protein